MGSLIPDAFETVVLLVDAPSPALCAPTWLIAPLQRAWRADRESAFSGEIKQRDWRGRAHPGGACVWAGRHLRPLSRIGLGQRSGQIGGEVQDPAVLRVLPRALMAVAHVRIEAGQGAPNEPGWTWKKQVVGEGE